MFITQNIIFTVTTTERSNLISLKFFFQQLVELYQIRRHNIIVVEYRICLCLITL